MTTGEQIYLAMVIASMGVFAIALAYYSLTCAPRDRQERQSESVRPVAHHA